VGNPRHACHHWHGAALSRAHLKKKIKKERIFYFNFIIKKYSQHNAAA
jgi:hypothetical protein